MRVLIASSAVVLGLALGATLGGCKLQVSGTGPSDDGGENDATEDVAADAQDSGPEGPSCGSGLLCNGKCIQATDCTSCSGAPLLCASQSSCTSDCSACQDGQNRAMPIECFACDQNHANPVGKCAYDDATQYCLSGDYAAAGANGGFRCICGDAGVSACPGDTQVCASTPTGARLCITCGEVFPSDVTGQPCKNGKSCLPSSHACN
ncbi:MAG TPA: hypothetical protein VIF09_25205 [Polyangiaceae bacterium]|jgi:hypothetical protein